MDRLRTLVSAPMSVHSIVDVHRSMREVISKQGSVKHSLDEARQALKSMLASFIDRLGAMTTHTGAYRGKIEGYAARIEETDDLTHLSKIVQDLLSDTRDMQSDMGRTHTELQAAHRRAEEYESKVRSLESQLEQVSGLVCEDPLTSALNRRGLDEAFQKESARCQRGGQPLSVAVLDVDNFKLLNDRLGHQAGDYALMHLVDVVREAIRPTDVLGRYGGEEFVILLPDTGLEAAEIATVRVQRALTRRFFLHNNERQLITFSAGVAQFSEGESWDTVLDRADRALYEAKRLGKNRVSLAPAPQPGVVVTPPAGSPARSA
jgi:diguanylate cyclase